MKFLINMEDVKAHIAQLQNKLLLVETKGESIEHLHIAMIMVRQMFDSLEEVPEPKEKLDEK